MSEPGAPGPFGRWTTRQAERRVGLVRQSWPEFLRGLAIETAIVVALVVIVALLIWLLRG